jgi:hypothetical protein
VLQFRSRHPGGVCWGAGTGLQVTPDILPANAVSIKFGATAAYVFDQLDAA